MSRWHLAACWKRRKWKMIWRSPPSHPRHWSRRDIGARRPNRTKWRKRERERVPGTLHGGPPAWKSRWNRLQPPNPTRRRRIGERKRFTETRRRMAPRGTSGRRWKQLLWKKWRMRRELEFRRWRIRRSERLHRLQEMRGRRRWRQRYKKRLRERTGRPRKRLLRWIRTRR